jgi:hypothetical protein
MSAVPIPPLPDDEVVEAGLRRLVALADPVPAGWREVAAAAGAWLALDGEPAVLAYDSVSGRERPLDGVRLAGVTMRELRFTGALGDIDLELDVGSDQVRLRGRLTPPGPADVTVAWPTGRREVAADDRGTFHAEDLPRQPLCLLVAGEEPTKTGWIVP